MHKKIDHHATSNSLHLKPTQPTQHKIQCCCMNDTISDVRLKKKQFSENLERFYSKFNLILNIIVLH